MKDAGHILRVNVAERRRRKPHPPPPVPQFEPRVRKLFMLDNCIHYCQPAGILRNVLITVLEVTTGANCCQQNCTSVRRVLATKGSLFELESGKMLSFFLCMVNELPPRFLFYKNEGTAEDTEKKI